MLAVGLYVIVWCNAFVRCRYVWDFINPILLTSLGLKVSSLTT